MAVEQDIPPAANTMRRSIWDGVAGIGLLRNFWGRRLMGTIGLVFDIIAEGANQAFYARLPGHSQQAPDSLAQVGRDRDLFRFRGETAANWVNRVWKAWDDYEQGGTPQQLLRVINQWGNAGWPTTWPSGTITLEENVDPSAGEFICRLTIPFGMIDPPLTPELWGGPRVWGEVGFYYGIGGSTDIPTLLYLVRKWKGARNRALVRVYYGVSSYIEFIV